MACHRRKLALWGSLSYGAWTVAWYPSKKISVKLEPSFKKSREGGRGEGGCASSFFCVCDKKLSKSRKKMLYKDASFHGSLKPASCCLYCALSYFSKKKIMERQRMRETTARRGWRRPFDRECLVTKATIHVSFVFSHIVFLIRKGKDIRVSPAAEFLSFFWNVV